MDLQIHTPFNLVRTVSGVDKDTTTAHLLTVVAGSFNHPGTWYMLLQDPLKGNHTRMLRATDKPLLMMGRMRKKMVLRALLRNTDSAAPDFLNKIQTNNNFIGRYNNTLDGSTCKFSHNKNNKYKTNNKMLNCSFDTSLLVHNYSFNTVFTAQNDTETNTPLVSLSTSTNHTVTIGDASLTNNLEDVTRNVTSTMLECNKKYAGDYDEEIKNKHNLDVKNNDYTNNNKYNNNKDNNNNNNNDQTSKLNVCDNNKKPIKVLQLATNNNNNNNNISASQDYPQALKLNNNNMMKITAESTEVKKQKYNKQQQQNVKQHNELQQSKEKQQQQNNKQQQQNNKQQQQHNKQQQQHNKQDEQLEQHQLQNSEQQHIEQLKQHINLQQQLLQQLKVASEEGMKEVEEGEEEVRSLERREGLLKAELNEVEEVDWLEQRNIYKERRKSAEEQLRRAERGVECAKEELEDMKKEFEGLQKVLVELQSKGACLEKQCYKWTEVYHKRLNELNASLEVS